jgi:Spy/CpxP family protein refolding chaperone
MKNLLTLFLLASLVCSLAFAEQEASEETNIEATKNSAHASGRHGKSKQNNYLGLTEQQQEQIREIRENGGSRDEVRAVLTVEQRKLQGKQKRKRMENRKNSNKRKVDSEMENKKTQADQDSSEETSGSEQDNG